MKQLKRNLMSSTVLPAVVAAGAVLAVGFTVVPCGRGPGNRIYNASAENPEGVPAPVALRGMNAGCCAAACDACNPCAAACSACNPCAAECNPCNPCAATCGACGACGAWLQDAVSGMNAGCCAAACDACNPCAAECNPCNPCAAACNPCNPCAASCGACGASLEGDPVRGEAITLASAVPAPGSAVFLPREYRLN
jgi:hypothetical protein